MGLFRKQANELHGSTERLSAYLDKAMPASEREAVEAHLGACSRCARELQTLRESQGLLQAALPMVAVPRSFALRPFAALVARARWQPALALRMAAAAALAALAFVVAADTLGLIGRQAPPIPLQAGVEEPRPFISAGTQPSPEGALPLAADAPGATSMAGSPAGPGGGPVSSSRAPFPAAPEPFLILWPLELGLLALVVLLFSASILVPRWGRAGR